MANTVANGIRVPKKRKAWNLFFLALPLMLLVFMFNYVPLLGWVLSLFEYIPGTPLLKNKFVGLKYFRILFTSRDMARVMFNTIMFSLIRLALLACPMFFAGLLNEIGSKRFRKSIQTLTTLPYFISWIIVYSLAFSMFSSEGLITQALGMKQSILTDKDAVYWFQSLLTLWKNLGWDAIIYIAAIAGIPQELYEAAAVDGAGYFRRAIYITIPELMNTFIVLLLLFIANFINNGMDQYFAFRNTLVLDQIENLELYSYRLGLQLGDYSFATAVGIFKSVVSIALLFAANTFAKKVRGTPII